MARVVKQNKKPVWLNGSHTLLVTLTEELQELGLKEGDDVMVSVEDGSKGRIIIEAI